MCYAPSMLNVHIRNNATGEVRVYRKDKDEPWDETDDYLWSDGNFGCDCNRGLFFAAAGGEGSDPDIPCGDSAFTVWIENEAGQRLYDDNAPPLADAG